MNFQANLGEMRRRDAFISIFLALYILSAYIPPNTIPQVFVRLVYYIFLGITLFKMITRQTPLKITQHAVWYFAFGILGLLSGFYAVDLGYVFTVLHLVLIVWIVSFSFGQYVHTASSFRRLFAFYAYSPFFLVFYLFLSGITVAQGERFGQGLFYNANQLAMSLMISLFCISWLMLYGSRKSLFINIVSAAAVLYITALTGGRKYLLVPFIFFFLLLILKNWTTNKLRLVLYLFLYMLVVIFAVWAVINIPALYYSVGVRFEGLMSFFEGDLANPDASTAVRYMMIDNGWRWFLRQPILGYGLNSFAFMFSPVLYDVYAHNNYVELLVDLGILGFLVYYSFYVYISAKLIRIQDDITGLRNFFLAYMLALPIFEVGAVTYQYFPVQIFLALTSAYVWLYEKGRMVQPVFSPSAADSQESRKAVTTEEKLFQQRLGLLQLAEGLGSVSKACRQRGVSRTQFYEYRRRYRLHGMEGLKNLPSTRSSHSRTQQPETKTRVLTMSMEHPDWGRVRLSNQLQLDGFLVSASTVQYTLSKNDMGSKCKRLLKLEKQALQHTIELTPELVDQIEKANPCFRERHVESSRPAELLSQDMIYVGRLTSVGNVYLHTVVDTYGSYAFGFLDTSKQLDAAVTILQNEVLPFYERLDLQVIAILTNHSYEFNGNNIRMYKSYLNLHKIEQRHTKLRSLQSNGFTDRFNRTVLDEFFRPAFHSKLYEEVDALQQDFDVWLVHYNTRRAHQGYPNMGRCPMDTIRDYLKSVQEETQSYTLSLPDH